RHTEQLKELDDSLAAKKITPEEFRAEREKVNRDYKDQRAADEHQLWETTVWTSRLLNMVLPPGWLPLGPMELTLGNVLRALLGTEALTLIGWASLWRAYRTTMRFYTGQFTRGRVRRPVAVARVPEKRATVTPDLFLERTLPGLTGQVSAIALAGFRSM